MRAMELSEEEAKYLVADCYILTGVSRPKAVMRTRMTTRGPWNCWKRLIVAGMDATVGLNQGDSMSTTPLYEQGATDGVAFRHEVVSLPRERNSTYAEFFWSQSTSCHSVQSDEEVRFARILCGLESRHKRRRKRGAQKQLDKQFNRIAQDRFNRKQRDLLSSRLFESRRSSGSFDDGKLEDELVSGDPHRM